MASRNSSDWVRRYGWLAPVAATCVLLGITAWINGVIYEDLENWSVIFVPSTDDVTARFARLGALMWGSSVILFLAVCVAASTVLLATCYRSVRDAPRRVPSLRTAGELAGAVALLFLLLRLSPLSSDKPFAAREFVNQMMTAEIERAVDDLWIVTLLAASLVLAGACACLIEPRAASPIAVEPFADRDVPAGSAAVGQHLAGALRVQNRRLQSVLFAGAAVLVAGIIELDALYGWAASVASLAKPDNSAAILITAATVPTGTFFSLFLTAVYVPAALILRDRAAALARIALPGTAMPEQARWLQENGLATPVSSQITSLVALLGPVLASGPLNALGQVFG
jgi:hypothetical protein